jgi:C4-dicarboxylate-specific signal transduction histidine kinase
LFLSSSGKFLLSTLSRQFEATQQQTTTNNTQFYKKDTKNYSNKQTHTHHHCAQVSTKQQQNYCLLYSVRLTTTKKPISLGCARRRLCAYLPGCQVVLKFDRSARFEYSG